MPITKEIAARNADCSAVVSLLDKGTAYSSGHLSIYNSDATKLTWHALSLPAFGIPVDGTSTAYPLSDATALIDGTANNFSFDNKDGIAIWRGNVTLNGYGGSLLLDSIVVPKDTTVVISSAIYVATEATFSPGVTGIQGSTGLALGSTGIQGILGRTGIQGFTGLALGSTGIQGQTGVISGWSGELFGVTGIFTVENGLIISVA